MSMSSFYVQVGISSTDYNQRNHLYIKKSIDKQPAGLSFYEQRWNTKQKGRAQVWNDEFSFVIPNVLSVTGTEDVEYPERGLYKFSVQCGVTAEEFILHDQARIQLMEIIQGLVFLGWHPYIEFYSDPRLSGQHSFQYAIQDGIYTPDPLYTPTLDEWMKLGSGHSWVFHVNGVFMEVAFRRSSQFMDKNDKGVYLLTYNFHTREARARNHFQGDERESWQELWVESIKNDKLARYKKEVELIKKGYHINTQYVEPKIHPDDPVEPEGEEVEELLAFIQQNNPKSNQP